MKYLGSYMENGVLIRVLKTYSPKASARTYKTGSAKNSRAFKSGGDKPGYVRSSRLFGQ